MKQLREEALEQALNALQSCGAFVARRKRSALRYKGWTDFEHALIEALAHGAAVPGVLITREHGRLHQEGWNMAYGLCLPYLAPLVKHQL